MQLNTKLFSSRRIRCYFFIITTTTFLFLISINYSVYVKTKAYEIYIKFDKSSIKSDIKRNEILNIDSLSRGIPTTSKISATKEKEKIPISIKISMYSYTNATELCSILPPHLNKKEFNISDLRIKIKERLYEFNEIENIFQRLSPPLNNGGLWTPNACKPRHRVAIIVPYRDREKNLKLFLNHLHPFLMRQQIDYGIFLIEPVANVKFNRGLLMNIGYAEVNKMFLNSNNEAHYQCYAFHDVDLLPEDDRNLYTCPKQPRHMSSAVSTFNYKLPYDTLFGGVTMFSNEQYEKVNGFSNLFFGWGGEDDDLANRILYKKLKITRYPLEIGRYTMANHAKDKPNQDRHKYLTNGTSRMDYDGLSSLKYKILNIQKTLLFTKFLVYYNQTEIMKENM